VQGVQGAFDGDQQIFLLVGDYAQQAPKQERTEEGITQQGERHRTLHAAVVDLSISGSLSTRDLAWNLTEITRPCSTTSNRGSGVFREIRYWGTERSDITKEPPRRPSVFIG